MSLTTAEKADFVNAIKKLKTTPAPNDSRVTNWYDHFVAENLSKTICWSHEANQGGYGNYGPDLLTWHRAFLLEFQDALTQVAGHPIALPYWDWTDPASTAVVFADDFMGPAGKSEDDYTVTSGPFAKGQWAVNVKGFAADNPGQFDELVRATGDDRRRHRTPRGRRGPAGTRPPAVRRRAVQPGRRPGLEFPGVHRR